MSENDLVIDRYRPLDQPLYLLLGLKLKGGWANPNATTVHSL